MEIGFEKIGIFGLDGAGKTSIVQSLKGQFTNFLDNLPTTSIEQHISNLLGKNIIIWDYPGQINLRKYYLYKATTEVDQMDSLIIVIDITDTNRMEENLDYMEKLLKKFRSMSVLQCSLYFHKYDIPYDETNEQIITQYKTNLQPLLNKYKYIYEFFKTSIKRPDTVISAFSHSIFKKTKYHVPIELLMEKFSTQWNISEMILFASPFFKVGRISKSGVHNDPISDDILSYLKEIEDSNNVISDLEIQLDDVQIHFSKFHCQIRNKFFPLYLVWRNSRDNSPALTREMEKMKEKMNALLVSDCGVPAMVG